MEAHERQINWLAASTQSGIAQQPPGEVVEVMESASVNGYYYQRLQGRGNANAGSNYWSQVYGGQVTEHDDIEEGEARGHGSKYDPDVAFSYLDLKLQNVLGHLQKDFEGGVSADKLGSKFGGYGSFLPIRERSPSVLLQPKPTAVVQNYGLQKSPNEGTVEHIRQKATGPVSTVTSTKLTSLANKNASGSGALASDFANKRLTAANAVKDNDPIPVKIPLVDNDVKDNNQTKFKLRFKMASDSVSRQKNTAIYSGLGLEHSSSPSLEDSPHKLEKFSTEAESTHDLSPSSIIQIMTSHHIPGSCLLSPLPGSVLNLLELKEEPCKKDGTAWTGIMGIREGPLIDSTACKEIRQQKEKNDISGGKSVNFKEHVSGMHGDTAKEVTKDAEINSRFKDHVPNHPKFTSKSSIKEACPERLEMGIACDSEKGSLRGICLAPEAPKSQTKDKGFKSSLSREDHKEAVVSRDPGGHVKTGRGLMPKYGNETPKEQRLFQVMEEKKGIVRKDFASDVRKIGKETLKDQKKISLQKDSTSLCKGKNGHKDETKGAQKEKVPGRVVIHEIADRQKQHGKEVGAENKIKQKDTVMSKAELKEKTNSGLKQMHKELRKETHEKDPLQSGTFNEGVKRNKEVTEATAKEFCRDGRKERLDVTKGVDVAHHKETVKWTNSESFEREPSRVIEREKDRGVAMESSSRHLKYVSSSKVHASNSVVSQPLPVQTAAADACLAQVAPVVIEENWVCCDACGKWRLLPYGVEDRSLPTNWLCHMIYWLPGMNSCDVGEEEATQAHYALYGQPPGVQVETNQGQSLPAAASVSMPTHDIKQAEQSEDPKSLKLGTKSGTGKKGQVQKRMANFSDTAKLSGLSLRKNEPGCTKGRNNDMELCLHQAEASVGLCNLPDEGNIKGVKDLKHKGKEKAKIKQISEGPDTEGADARPLKVKRKREAESKECMFAKKAKTKDSKGHDTEVGDSATLKIRMMESKSKKHEDVKMVKSEGMKCAREDFFEGNESGDRVGPSGYDNEPVKLSGGKTKRLKEPPKHLKNETSDCSVGADGRLKYQQRAFAGTDNRGTYSGCGTGPDTEAADAHPLKVKRRREDESKEYVFAKKAKTKDSIGHDTEVGDSATLKIRIMEGESQKHEDVKMVRSEDITGARRDSFEENESDDRVGPSRHDNEPAKLSGGKTKRLKDPPKHLKNETSDCSFAADGRLKCRQQAYVETGNRGTHSGCDTGRSDKKDYSTKKRKLKEWKESQTCRQGVSMKEESETEWRRETVSKTERRESNGVKDGKKRRVNKSLSSKQALLLDETEGKSSGGFDDEEHEVGQSRVHGVIQGVSDGTDSLKRDSGHRPLFASETSSSSKVSCHPKIVSTLQDVRGSPVESTVSSSPVRSFKAGKLQLARSNSTGIDDLMYFRKPSPRRCSDGEGDAQSDPSGPRTRVVGNMVRAMGDTAGGRDGKQFSNDKIKDKNVHKKQGMGSSDAGNFAAGRNNLPFANDVKCSSEMRVPDRRQVEDSEHNIMDVNHERRGGREKSLSAQERERVKSYHDKTADKLHGYTRDGNDKGNVNERNIWSERMLSGHHEAHSACSKDLYDDKLTGKEDKELKNCMAFNGNKELKLKTSGTSIKGNQLRQNMGQSKEIPHFGSHDSHAKRHMDSFSRQGKAVVSNYKDGKLISRQSLRQGPFVAEMASDRCLPERNVLTETALVKDKPKVSSHSANMSEVQGNGTAVEVLLNRGSQLQGSAYDASSGESSRAPRESVAAANGTQSCDVRPLASNGLVGRDAKGTVASPIKKEHLQATGNAALKEATDLKHKADRLKSIGGDELESTSLYFRASLKFLHSASLLEPCNADGLKQHGESQSITVYTDTAKLCEFCAGEYERNKEMAAAALAYKCKGVAHMRVVVAKNALISRDRHELQAAAQVILPGESPSSSASDIDNLNNHVLMDRDLPMDQAKGAESLQVPGNEIIVGPHRPHLVRLLQYTQDINAAIEAFAKAECAFVAARDSNHGSEDISAVKRAIDFNFCDIDGLLRLVLLAMEAFDH